MALKIFIFQEKIMIDNFLINLTQLEKSGLIGRFLILLANLILKCTSETKRQKLFFAILTLLLHEKRAPYF